MDEQQIILQHSKDLTLGYLKKIDAKINESHGLYTIEIPPQFEKIFGGIRKRITFEPGVADTHSCEFVVLGSNFLATILNEIRKQAPVIGGHLKKQAKSPSEFLDNIKIHNGTATLVKSSEEARTAIRFYFNINIKSVKSSSMLRWIDIDFETLKQLEFPEDVEIDSSLGKIRYKKNKIYSKPCGLKSNEIVLCINSFLSGSFEFSYNEKEIVAAYDNSQLKRKLNIKLGLFVEVDKGI